MTIAVVMIAAGRRDHLARALGALGRQTRPPDDVVVVDMRPTQPIADVVASPARTVPLAGAEAGDGALPLAAARNAGAAATDTDHLVFLDVDCLADPWLVERYDAVLRAHPGSLACGPVRYLREGWHAVAGPLDRLDALSEAPPSRPVPPAAAVRLGEDHEMFWSLSFGTTRATWARIGGFDGAYQGYGAEDTDFALRARASGIRMAWFGGGVAYHQWHPPTRFDPARTMEIVGNAHRFRARWGTWPMDGWLRDLHDRGLVDFDDAAGRLGVVEHSR